QLRPALSGVSFDTTLLRPATYTSDALHNLGLGLLIATVLAALALGAWLLCARAASIALMSVGLSLLSAVFVLDLLGYTFNAVVALGLLMALSLVVGEAISFSTELVRRLRDHANDGTPVRVMVLDAAARLWPALSCASLIALAAAAPVFFAKGLSATFLHPMMLAFALAVVVSMALAMTLTPALALLLLERQRPHPRELMLAQRAASLYRVALRRTPIEACVAACALGIAGWVALPFLHKPAPPAFKDRSLVVQWQGPPGASLGEMDRVTQRVVAAIRGLRSVGDAGAVVGRAVSADLIGDVDSGQIFVTLKPGADYGRALSDVRGVVEGTPGIRASVGNSESEALSGVLAPANHAVTVRVYGRDLGQLGTEAGRVRQRLSGLPGLGGPQVQIPVGEPNIEVSVNDGAALRAGVLPGDARRQASTLVSGLTVGNFFQDQAVFDVVVQGTPSVRGTLGEVRNLLIDTSGGGHVRLGDIARVGVRPDPVDIQHQALSRYVDVTVPLSGLSVADARSAIQRRLSGMTFPLTYHAEVLGSTPEDATSHFAFVSYVLVAALAVFLLLQAALRNWRLAGLLFLVLPSSLAGGLLISLISGQTASIGSDVGLLAVFLLAARQGILQLTQIRMLQAREGGPTTPPLVMRAVSERFVPAVGSALVIAVMLVPFILIGDGPGNEMIHTAAAVMLGGLVSAFLLTQLVLPALCLVLGPKQPITAEDYEDELDLPELATPTATPF
ncbi:MAG: efflux RND transporter permease subunit, partial [Solirubrobacterales bacterium]|nr:efflux RND transporter permease subunit [Solirubrobacterales bacterium]